MNGLLFIDDEEGVRRSLKRAFKRAPYPTFTASNGRDGIGLVASQKDAIATVISDYRMPGLDGLETLVAIGNMNPDITRIILTGYATMEAAIMATNEGIDGFLTKPFDNIELRAKIHDIWVRKHLKQFVSEPIYEEINKSPNALEPRFHNVTVLFSDIRNFTRMAQHTPPEALVDFLNNDYFTPMGEIVYELRGTMDKHIGDSMMVVFGSPLEGEDDALRAVRCAMRMQAKARQIDGTLNGSTHLQLKTGIGIASGRVFSGIVGSMRKKEFTSLGMPVNIAARLQGLARGGEILMNQATYEIVQPAVPAEALPPTKVKGVDSPLQVYRINPPR
jgi:adenylate cyclase